MIVGDIHWVQLPAANGREQRGRRPAVILQDNQYAGGLPVVLVIPLGNVSNMLFLYSYHEAEFIAINKQPNHNVVQQHRFGKTDRHSHEPLQSRSKGEMLPCNCLRIGFADCMLGGLEMTIIHIYPITLEMANTPWCSQRFSLPEDVVLLGP